MLRADYCRYLLDFKEPSRTSRQVMTQKETFFIKIWDEEAPGVFGLGECALFRGLSAEDNAYYEKVLRRACDTINEIDVKILQGYSSIRFGIETALRDLNNGGRRIIYDTPWSRGQSAITINGLIWMGTRDQMLARIARKLDDGFRCLKLKIGGIDFDSEVALLEGIRAEFPATELELRLDANGAFTPDDALLRLDRLARCDIHSIEQPIKPRQYQAMYELCEKSPIPIALDEELIGVNEPAKKRYMLDRINPRYIILKPSLCGGLTGAYEWIQLAQERGIGWWITSALESNVGLNAIAQFASTFDLAIPQADPDSPHPIPQGLGTGALYTNNIPSPLTLSRDTLAYDPARPWDLSEINL